MSDMAHSADLEAAAQAAARAASEEPSSCAQPLADMAAHYRFLADIPVRLSVEVGAASLAISEVLALTEGSVVKLGRLATDLLDINVNGTLVARGEIITIDDRFAVRIAEVVNGGRPPALERRA